jgi:hypothetical protein
MDNPYLITSHNKAKTIKSTVEEHYPDLPYYVFLQTNCAKSLRQGSQIDELLYTGISMKHFQLT